MCRWSFRSLLSLIVGLALANSPLVAENVVRLAIGEWAPYVSETDPQSKLLEKLVTEAFRLEGFSVEYAYFPWKRSYVMVQDGEFDGTFPWNRTAERDREFVVNHEPLATEEAVYFHLKSVAFDWKDLFDLRKYRVGATVGYRNEQTYRDNKIPFETVVNEEQNFQKLLAGRIDVYGTSKLVGYTTIRRLFPPSSQALFTHHPTPYAKAEFFLLFGRVYPVRSQMLSDRLDAGLRKLKASGAYDRMMGGF